MEANPPAVIFTFSFLETLPISARDRSDSFLRRQDRLQRQLEQRFVGDRGGAGAGGARTATLANLKARLKAPETSRCVDKSRGLYRWSKGVTVRARNCSTGN